MNVWDIGGACRSSVSDHWGFWQHSPLLMRPDEANTLPYLMEVWECPMLGLAPLRFLNLSVLTLLKYFPLKVLYLLPLVTFFHSCIFPASTSIVSFLAGSTTTAFCSAGSSILYQQCRIQTICTVHPPTIRMLSRSVMNSVLQMATFGGRCPLAPWSQTHLKRVVIIRV